jgi:hypothetical protein
LFSAWPPNTLFAMSESGAQMQNVGKIPIGLSLARRAVILVITVLVLAYFIAAFAIGEVKALWPRGRISHTD